MDTWFTAASLSEKIYELIVKNSKDAIIYLEPVLDSEGRAKDFTYVFMNEVASSSFKGSRSDFLGKTLLSLFPKDTILEFFICIKEAYERKTVIQRDFHFTGETFSGWFRNYITAAGDGILSFYSDITNEKKLQEQKEVTEKNLQESYQLINGILESIQDPFLVLDKELRIVYMNKASVNSLGGSEDYPKGELIWEAFPSLKNIPLMERYKRLIEQKRPVMFETRSGNEYFLVTAFPFADGISVYTKNITERIMLERKLRKTLKEKELLIKEIHHRVKNNLQIVASILNLQTSYLADASDIQLLQDTQTRVRAMALIHKKLYETDSINMIDLGSYIKEISATIFNTYNIDASRIKLNIQTAEVDIETNCAVSLGLILNELITNAIKYAFPENRTGQLRIEESIKQNKVKIVISDNGIGFPKDVDFRKLPSLGMQLILSLMQQLDGTIELDISAGTMFILLFDVKKLQHH